MNKNSLLADIVKSALAVCLLNWGIVSVLAAGTPDYFNVRSFGATGNGTNLDSPAINQAIGAAAAAGGGTVVFPAGTYLSGSIRLRSNIHLQLDAGAVILGAPQELNAYDETEPFTPPAYQDGGHTYFHNSLIWGENMTNVFITGHGMINGGGLVPHVPKLDRMAARASEGKAPELARDAQGRVLPHNGLPPVRIGNKAIALKLCRNIKISGITIYHGGHFAILATGCDNLTIDGVTIDTNRDGIDLDCCRNTIVSNCRVNSPRDDAICPKSTYALGEPRITENLTIVNCQISGFEEGTLLDGTMRSSPTNWGVGRLKFGTESSGGFRNVTIANCTFRNCHGVALEEVDGGILENFTINNLTMMDVKKCAIYLTTGKRNRTPNLTTSSRMRNILISNIVADNVDSWSGIIITGMPELPIEGVRLENIRLTSNGGGTKQHAQREIKELDTGYPNPTWSGILSSYGIFARHVKDLELANISLNFRTNDFRPAAQFANIDGLTIDNLKAQAAEGVRAVEFAPDVRGLQIRHSPALKNDE